MKKLILGTWSGDYQATKEKLKKLGNKILKVTSDKKDGHYIKYQHPKLTTRTQKGDLVQYINLSGKTKRGIVFGTEKDWWCIKDHVDVNNEILAIGNITKIIKKKLIAQKYL